MLSPKFEPKSLLENIACLIITLYSGRNKGDKQSPIAIIVKILILNDGVTF